MPQKKGKEEVGIMPTSKKNAGPHFIEVPGLVQDHFIVPILGVTPLILGKVPDGSKHQLITTQFAGRFRKGVKRPKPLNPLQILLGSIHQVNNCEKPKTFKLHFPFIMDWEGHTKPLKFKVTSLPGFPTCGLKKSIVEAADRLDGVYVERVRKAILVQGDMLSINYEAMEIEEVPDRNKNGTPIFSYLPALNGWSTSALISIMRHSMKVDSLVNLVEAAGEVCGLGVHRPEKDGSFGQFIIDRGRKIQKVDRGAVDEWFANHRVLREPPGLQIMKR